MGQSAIYVTNAAIDSSRRKAAGLFLKKLRPMCPVCKSREVETEKITSYKD